MNGLLLLVIGMFIGWNFPQPTYAKIFQEWFLNKVKKFIKNDKKGEE